MNYLTFILSFIKGDLNSSSNECESKAMRAFDYTVRSFCRLIKYDKKKQSHNLENYFLGERELNIAHSKNVKCFMMKLLIWESDC